MGGQGGVNSASTGLDDLRKSVRGREVKNPKGKKRNERDVEVE